MLLLHGGISWVFEVVCTFGGRDMIQEFADCATGGFYHPDFGLAGCDA
jgi:hypothetical protein